MRYKQMSLSIWHLYKHFSIRLYKTTPFFRQSHPFSPHSFFLSAFTLIINKISGRDFLQGGKTVTTHKIPSTSIPIVGMLTGKFLLFLPLHCMHHSLDLLTYPLKPNILKTITHEILI